MRLGVRNIAQGQTVETAIHSWRHDVNTSYPSGVVGLGKTIWQGNGLSSWVLGAHGVINEQQNSVMSRRHHSARRTLTEMALEPAKE